MKLKIYIYGWNDYFERLLIRFNIKKTFNALLTLFIIVPCCHNSWLEGFFVDLDYNVRIVLLIET